MVEIHDSHLEECWKNENDKFRHPIFPAFQYFIYDLGVKKSLDIPLGRFFKFFGN